MHGFVLLAVLALALAPLPALTANLTVDNQSPQVVFSPQPCFRKNNSVGCSLEWQLREDADALDGSVATTAGANVSLGIDILPRVSLSFQGTDILFIPGKSSTAQAGVTVDDRDSVLLNTSVSAYAGVGLDPARNHTISVTFVPSNGSTTLDVDYFQITQPDAQIISTTTPPSTPTFSTTLTVFFTTTATVSVSATPTSAHALPDLSRTAIPTGTIIAVVLSGAIILTLALLLYLCAARRRRRRLAVRRERDILYGLQLPSEQRLGLGAGSGPWPPPVPPSWRRGGGGGGGWKMGGIFSRRQRADSDKLPPPSSSSITAAVREKTKQKQQKQKQKTKGKARDLNPFLQPFPASLPSPPSSPLLPPPSSLSPSSPPPPPLPPLPTPPPHPSRYPDTELEWRVATSPPASFRTHGTDQSRQQQQQQ